MEKYGVVADNKGTGKTASDGLGCPRCGAAARRSQGVLICPNCGTEPFENSARKDERQGIDPKPKPR